MISAMILPFVIQVAKSGRKIAGLASDDTNPFARVGRSNGDVAPLEQEHRATDQDRRRDQQNQH